MAETKNIAVLFDFDGVVVDTETQYSVFWHKMGVDYLGMEDLESRVKGQTLMYIYDTFFPGMTASNRICHTILFPGWRNLLPIFTVMV